METDKELYERIAKEQKLTALLSNPEDAEYYLEAIQYIESHDTQAEVERIMKDYEANS